MKKRFSVKKAEWSNKREDEYKHDSLEIAYKLGIQLIQRDSIIYKLDGGKEILFCEADSVKKVWFQTWKKLRELI